MEAPFAVATNIEIKPSWESLRMPRSGFYRLKAGRNPPPVRPQEAPTPPPRALSPAKRQGGLNRLHYYRFIYKTPQEMYATLLEEKGSIAALSAPDIPSLRTENKARRNQLTYLAYQKPQVLNTASNHVWSWDIIKIMGPATWSSFCLYVTLNIFSHYVVS